jgi:nitrogen fixation-related uncharacterized protein
MEQLYFLLINVVILAVIISVAVWFGASANGRQDDEVRLNSLIADGEKRFPNSPRKSLLEFIRRDLYYKIRLTANNGEDIGDLTEDYAVILEAQEQLERAETEISSAYSLRRDTLIS